MPSPPPSSATTPLPPLLDHLVILLPHALLASPPSWLGGAFRLAPGGRHADGLTENALALLPDGSYLEFIAFVPGADGRGTHRWGRIEPEGAVIDWALTLHDDDDDDDDDDGKGRVAGVKHEAEFREIRSRVREQAGGDGGGGGYGYGDPVRGGRVRPDGVALRWAVASAKRKRADGDNGGDWEPAEPGQLPFWCLDETPRRLRVPFEENGDMLRHPSGVVGVAEVAVAVGGSGGDGGEAEVEKEKEALSAVYDAVLGKKKSGGGDRDGWETRTLAGEGLHPPGRVVLSAAKEGAGSAAGDIKITFYTDDENWVGKTIGGKIDDEHSLEFKLVAAKEISR